MPTYVYKCADNGHIFELVQKFSADPGAECPTCSSQSRRQITAPTVIYKGSGFYTTDYGHGRERSGAEADSGGNGDSKDATKATTSNDGAGPSKGGEKSESKSSSKDSKSSD